MDNTGEQLGLMAETLIVLAGENAWSAARGFAQFSVHRRDVAQARFWRNVARGVLKRCAAKLASSAQAFFAPPAAPTAPEPATADSNSTDSWKNLGRAPIPLRARRTLPLLAMSPEDAPAKAVVEGNAAGEMLLARAA